MAFHRGPKIITDGLVLYVDAANPKSYVSGSTTTTSLVGSITGSLLNGVGYSNGSNGSWVFDGSNDYITGSSNLNIPGNALFSICYWATWDDTTFSTNYPSAVGNNSTGVTNIGLSTTWQNGRIALDFWNNRFRAVNSLTTQTWYYVCFTKMPGIISTTTKLYVNSNEVAGAVEGSDVSPNISDSPFVIGRLDNTRYFKGRITNVKIYNRALSADEVLQNYNATKSRFDL